MMNLLLTQRIILSKITQKIKSYRNKKHKRVTTKISIWYEQKLRWGSKLKPGDIVCDCKSKNLPIKSIVPEYGCSRYKNAIGDYQIELIDGSFHSLIHCCQPISKPSTIHLLMNELGWETNYDN